MNNQKSMTDSSIDKHYQGEKGHWYPIILDPMGDRALMTEAFCKQWLAEQEAERKALQSRGEILAI